MKIAIIGTHSTGKTTLLKALKPHLNLSIITEIARQFPRDITDNPMAEMTRQIDIFRKQFYTEKLYENFISDRATVDNAAYMINALKIYGNLISPIMYINVIKNINKAINHAKEYDYLFYIPIEFDTVDDGFRNTDNDERVLIDMIIKEIMPESVMITGTVEERVKKVLEVIK